MVIRCLLVALCFAGRAIMRGVRLGGTDPWLQDVEEIRSHKIQSARDAMLGSPT